jgi:hypothetical protein
MFRCEGGMWRICLSVAMSEMFTTFDDNERNALRTVILFSIVAFVLNVGCVFIDPELVHPPINSPCVQVVDGTQESMNINSSTASW